MISSPPLVALTVMSPEAGPGRYALRCYLDDVASRYYGRQATDEEIDAALGDAPSADLVPPHGLLLVAQAGAEVVGCAGLRLLAGHVGEVKRVWVAAGRRRQGLGRRLLGRLEELARERDVSTLRLDTRHDLVEARRLYARLGYRETSPFNDDKYAEHWLAKPLT